MEKRILYCACLLVSLLTLIGCNQKQTEVEHSLGFEEFMPQYNAYIREWLGGEIQSLDKLIEEKKSDLVKQEDDEVRGRMEKTISELEGKRFIHQRRLDYGEYFMFKKPSDLPDDLVWENGLDNPEIGDPRAIKGGIYRDYMPDFPSTLRPFGDNSNNSFRSFLYDNVQLDMISIHPVTKKVIPAVAKEWAIDKDGRTVYYRIDPDATYSDGVKVKALDYMVGTYIRVSDNVKDPYPRQYFREQIAHITVYAEDLIAVTLPDKKPLLPYYAQLANGPTHFYKEFGPDYNKRYQWKMEPTTGAYYAHPEDVKKGRSVTLTRVKNWWARDKKFYRYRFNPDRLVYTVVKDPSKAFELFAVGQLDAFVLRSTPMWYDKMEIDNYFNGYIEKAQFYNESPRPSVGFYLNVSDPLLKDINVRKGIAHSLNFNKVNTVMYRGDSERLNHYSEGYGDFSNPNVRAREFSVSKARDYFAKAGYRKLNSEGFLINDKGQRLELEVSWSTHPRLNQMMSLLQEDAKKAGLKLLLDSQQPTVNFRKILEKRHQCAYAGWNASLPFPRYFGSFHSSNAFDEQGNPKKQTNNINMYANPEMDRYAEAMRNAVDEEELKEAAWKAAQLVHDEAIFIPAFKTSYSRVGYWNWVKWPNTQYTEFCDPTADEPMEVHMLWIDQKVKARTLKAMREGLVLPEQNHIFDLYKGRIPTVEELDQRQVIERN
ncbi:ABC transporter substrate-binding protein [Rubritalea sp.]|uniref:ABC transporter substrate-binding protein n=1 Tax=Rubritalea sp. TaxID=2109375 RepID=UPI003EF94789